jgi:outer membrane protein assembly factor BamD (BamD/ComL family)
MDIMRDAFPRAVTGDRLKSELFEMNDLVESLGYDELAQVDPLLEQRKYDEAATVLREVARRYKGFDCYKDAKARYEELREENERFKQAADRFDDEDAAARIYLEARDKLSERRYGESYDKLQEVVTEYPDTQAAEFAEAMLDRMKRNSNFWKILKDYQAGTVCRGQLASARSLIGQRRYSEAEKILRAIVEDFPNTKWEREAVEELKRLP